MKKLSVYSIVNLVGAVLALVALIVAEVSFKTSQGWFDLVVNGSVIACAIFAILAFVANALLTMFNVGADCKWMSVVKDLLSATACVCLGVMVGQIIYAIATEFAYTFFSDFNVGTVKEKFIPTACMQSVGAIVVAIVGIVVASVNGIFKK